MIFERASSTSTSSLSSSHPMLRCHSPDGRTASPAMSEISVGSPSPPPPRTAFQPLNMKRIRLAQFAATGGEQQAISPGIQQVPPTRRKSCAERTVKSFSIADILGKRDTPKPPTTHAERTHTTEPPFVGFATTSVNPARLHQQVPASTKVLQPWDAADSIRLQAPPPPSSAVPAGPIPMRPFFPPAALFHYEQRLAWDYQRQLQEHFHVQAQLLRQMSLDPTIIPSEDGSDRCSRSSSTGSDCCTPDEGANCQTGDDLRRDPDVESDGGDTQSKRKASSGQAKHVNSCAADGGHKTNKKSSAAAGDTPLDALFQLSTKNFDEEQDSSTLNIFATRPNPKKKRKSRTAFTNHQIFELEKRFLYQKYLSPADRDEIAAGLGLSNAQVITWFQNRRAKLKRDMEELKKDVESVKQLSAHKSFLENVNDFSILKKRPVSRHQQHHTPPLPTTTTTTSPQTTTTLPPTRQPPTADDGKLSPKSVAIDFEGSNGGRLGNSTRPTYEAAARFQSNNNNSSRG